jgi:hypothetical protein
MDARYITHNQQVLQDANYCPHLRELHIRTVIPLTWGVQLSHAVADLGITKAEALRQAVVLFLRYHGRAVGVPEPLPPADGSQ